MKTDFSDPKNWHSAANAFALLPDEGEDFQALVTDIKTNGLNNPIALYQGKVLDGRNRARACKAAGVEPEFFEWKPKKGQTPETWSASQNIYRRHLSADQRKVGDDELRGYTMFKDSRKEYEGLEKEYSEGWKKVKSGEWSLPTFFRHMDWLKSGGKTEETTLTIGGAAQAFLRFLSYETALPIYRTRQTQLHREERKIFDEAWALIREGIYGISTDL